MARARAEGDPVRAFAVGLKLIVAGGRSADTPVVPYTPPSQSTRNTSPAEHFNRKAADLLGTDAAHAEELLRQARRADLLHGPAHNDLGVVHLRRQMLYEDASELAWAKKPMRGHPDPRVNLGLVMEAAGRTDDALESYEAALEVWLQEIALRAEVEPWQQWARLRYPASSHP
jgi:tetratricopeptide (TPR) repeat protein